MDHARIAAHPPTPLVVRILAIVGVLSLCPVACASTCAVVKYRADAAESPTPVTVSELQEGRYRTSEQLVASLEFDRSRQLVVESDAATRTTLVGVAEAPRVLVRVENVPQQASDPVLLHRDDAVLIGVGREGAFVESFGLRPSEVTVYRAADLRARASGEASAAGWAAIVSWPLGLLCLGAAVSLGRRRRRKAP